MAIGMKNKWKAGLIAGGLIIAIGAGIGGYYLAKGQKRALPAAAEKHQIEQVTPVPVSTYTPSPEEVEKRKKAQASPTASTKPAAAPQRVSSSVNTETGSGGSERLEGRRICIDPGHGITSKKGQEQVAPGSSVKKAAHVSGASGKHITEEAFNLKVALKLRSILENSGCIVTMTRTSSECDLSNIDRAEMGNESDFVVRIHADGADGSSVNGISVLVPEKSYYGDDGMASESRRLGESILAKAVEKSGAKNRGISVRGDMTGFNWSKVPVALIECGFMSNPQEEEKLASDSYQQVLAEGIAEGILGYLEE